MSPVPQYPPVREFDVAVVGGGVAGCYVAYRLLHGALAPDSPLRPMLERKGRLDVGLFEYSGRVGGRLLSAELPDVPAPGDQNPGYLRYTEFGGFRFQPQMHIVRDLAALLELDHQPFPVDEPEENFVYLRGERLRRRDLTDPDRLPYDLTDAERKIVSGGSEKNPDLSTFVANQALASVLGPTGFHELRKRYQRAFRRGGVAQARYEETGERRFLEEAIREWETVRRLRIRYEQAKQAAVVAGRLLPDWPWWALQTQVLSHEALDFLEDSGGYNSLYSAGSAPTSLLESFFFADYPTDSGPGVAPGACTETVWRHVTEGYSAIPDRLFDGFRAAGGQGFLNRQLVGFDRAPDGEGYDLLFFQRESGRFSAAQAAARCASDPRSCETVRARFVVLAMPRRSLELLDQDTFFFRDDTVSRLLDSVLNVPAMRIFMAYREPWWKEAGVTCGRSTTDLPVRQFYYWLTSREEKESVLLASYTNGQAEAYWQDLERGAPFDDLAGARIEGSRRPTDPQGKGPRPATANMAELAHRQIERVVGREGPRPYYAHFQNWTKDPWGAGWHAFKAGQNDNELIPRILQPLPEERVYVCGECWSNIQGWVQGALNTSETLLQARLGLEWPPWLQRGGTWLGPGSDDPPLG